MKKSKSIAVAFAVAALCTLGFTACNKQEAAPKPDKFAEITDAKARMTALIDLGRKENATEEEFAIYASAIKNLTFKESEVYLQLVYEKGLAEATAKKDVSLIEDIERINAYKVELNNQSMLKFSKPYISLAGDQLESLEKDMGKQLAGGRSGRTKVVIPALSCAFAQGSSGSATFTATAVAPILYTNWQWADNDQDIFTPCDCQFAYPTTDIRYTRTFAGTGEPAARTALQARPIIRRRILSGVSTGTYLLTGTSTLNAFSSCPDFGNRIRLSR